MKSKELNQELVRKLFNYNSESGILTRRIKAGPSKVGSICGSSVNNRGYCHTYVDGSKHLIHRIAFIYIYGYLPEEIDHIDGVRANNSISNLRAANRNQNSLNRGAPSNNRSGIKGVSWYAKDKRWIAQIVFNKKKYSLGSFLNINDAESAVRLKREELHGEFANHG